LNVNFTTVTGVRQGCLLSAIIFLIVLDEVLRRSLEHLEDLDYADDIVLLSHNFGDMQAKLNNLVDESQKVGLRVNIEKTKDLRVNSRTTEAFRIGEKVIERVDDLLYLGSKIDENGGTLLDVQQRINKARGAFSRLKNVWEGFRNHSLILQLKGSFSGLSDNKTTLN
jgi:hypothetical protein